MYSASNKSLLVLNVPQIMVTKVFVFLLPLGLKCVCFMK